jgi:O-antigen ligase
VNDAAPDTCTAGVAVIAPRRQRVLALVVVAGIVGALCTYMFWGRAGLLFLALAAVPPMLVLLRWPILGVAWCVIAYFGDIQALVPFALIGPLALTLISVISGKAVRHDWTWRFTPVVGWTFLLFTLILFTATLVPVVFNPGYQLFAYTLAITLLVVECVRTPGDWALIMAAAAAAIVFDFGSTLYGIYHLFGHDLKNPTASTIYAVKSARFFGHWGGPNALSHSLAPIVPLYIAFLTPRFNSWIRWAAAVTLVAGLACVALTLSRAAILHVGVALAIMCFVSPYRWRIVVGTILVMTVAGVFLPVNLAGRLESFSKGSSDASFNERAMILSVAMDMAAESVPVGRGSGAFMTYEQDYFPDLHVRVFHAHNTYAQLLAENGFLGLLLFIGLLVSAGLAVWGARVPKMADGPSRLMRASLLATLTGMVLVLSFEYLVPWPSYWITFTLMSIFPLVFSEPETAAA